MMQIDEGIKTYVEGKRDPGGMLLPCPFCGKDVTLYGNSGDRRFHIVHSVSEPKCFTSVEFDWGTAGSIIEAALIWNRRAKNE